MYNNISKSKVIKINCGDIFDTLPYTLVTATPVSKETHKTVSRASQTFTRKNVLRVEVWLARL